MSIDHTRPGPTGHHAGRLRPREDGDASLWIGIAETHGREKRPPARP